MVDSLEPKTDLGISRLKICKECSWFRKDSLTCRQCGCGLILKVDREQNSCPIGKW
jgi:hypothetical protein